MNLERVTIDQLEPGMRLVSIDVPWKSNPFLLHNRIIRDAQDIENLKVAGVKTVTIDKHQESEPAVIQTCSSPQSQWQPSPTLKDELSAAKNLQQEGKKIVGQCCDDIKHNRPPLAEPLAQVIRLTIANLANNDETLLGLLNIIPKHDKLVAHLFNVMSLTLALSSSLGCTDNEKEILGLAAFIHDAGWIRLPLNLLNKRTPYTNAEMKLINRHTTVLSQLLQLSKGFEPSVHSLIEEHHERLDGSGYPNQKKSPDIHKLSKILMVADCYDEYLHGLAGHSPRPPTTVLKLLYRAARNGTFDEAIVAALINLVNVYPINSVVELENGEVGLVVSINRDHPLQPKVKVMYSASGEAYDPPQHVDLLSSTSHKNCIVRALDLSKPESDPARIIDKELNA